MPEQNVELVRAYLDAFATGKWMPSPNAWLLMPLRRHYSNPEVRQAIEQLWRELPASKPKRDASE